MSVHVDPSLCIEWMVIPDVQLDEEWQHVDCCAALQQPLESPVCDRIEEEDWWPGRCIP